ncbi:MAG: hypothetical protein IIZ93_16560 [Acidaminococcaceae bacterium]|nr:hypothetical protein [Acidaminococcaceae bacterium]MBQ1779767.1 hypothetical protein [Acidaminococcaceae bacterium]
MAERGVYEHPNRGKQLLRFDGMRFLDSITPTDIDALIEVRNQIVVFFEAKLKDKEVPFGQKLALERLVRNAGRAGKHAIAIIGEHNITDPSEDVFLKDLLVREVFTTEQMQWRPPKRKLYAKEAADVYIRYFYKVA